MGAAFWLLSVELTRERSGLRLISKAPPNDTPTIISTAPLAAFRLNAMARMEVVHGVKPRP